MAPTSGPQPPWLPANLPPPVDDDAAGNLPGLPIPHVRLQSTEGKEVDVAELAEGALVLYVFPKMGRPDEADPPGWDQIPGARGCTQQSCAFRDKNRQFLDLGYSVAGLSAQPAEQQAEAAERLHLGFPLLADPTRRLGRVLELPTFDIADVTLYKRLTLVARGRRIVKVFYPVFPPDENADEVLGWIRSNDGPGAGPMNCPRCGSSRVIPIVNGMPSSVLAEACERGEVAIGGCIVDLGGPTTACRDCGARFGNLRF